MFLTSDNLRYSDNPVRFATSPMRSTGDTRSKSRRTSKPRAKDSEKWLAPRRILLIKRPANVFAELDNCRHIYNARPARCGGSYIDPKYCS